MNKFLKEMLKKAKEIGVKTPECFRSSRAGKLGRSRMSERYRLFWALQDDGWPVALIAKTAGYSHCTLIKNMRRYHRPEPVTIPDNQKVAKELTTSVAAKHGIKDYVIWSRGQSGFMSNSPAITSARHEILRTLKLMGFSVAEIARMTTGRGHSSISVATRGTPASFRFGSGNRIRCHQTLSAKCESATDSTGSATCSGSGTTTPTSHALTS